MLDHSMAAYTPALATGITNTVSPTLRKFCLDGKVAVVTGYVLQVIYLNTCDHSFTKIALEVLED